ncbi:hypothetical protein AB6A23_20495 [Paenibacillus tarimensis]
MNDIQRKYVEAKTAFREAVACRDWEAVEALEGRYLDAEDRLIEWTLRQMEPGMLHEGKGPARLTAACAERIAALGLLLK